MTENTNEEATERSEPTGYPVVRGDPQITGSRAESAVEFDPKDPASLQEAAERVREMKEGIEETSSFQMLCGAAACATLVRGEGTYRDAAERAGDDVTVNFLRKWSRVHDLPIAIRRYIALGEIVPSAAQHVARVEGEARYLLAWAIIDHDLSVREVRSIASSINEGTSVTVALERHDALPGHKDIAIPIGLYHELRLEAAIQVRDLDEIIVDAVEEWLGSQPNEGRSQSE